MRAVTRFVLAAVAAISTTASAQNAPVAAAPAKGKPITQADIKAWNNIRNTTLSNDGKWFAYVSGATEGDATLYVKSTADANKELKINVGNGGGTFTISGDSKWIGYIVAPSRPATGGRGGRTGGGGNGRGGGGNAGAQDAGGAAGGAQARNKFVLQNLVTNEKKEFERIRTFQFNAESPTWIAMQGYGADAAAAAPAAAPAAGGRGGRGGADAAGGGGGGGSSTIDLLLYRIATGELVNIGNIGEFAFDDDGTWLAWTTEMGDMVGNGIQLRNLKTDVVRSIDAERALYRRLAWIDSVDAIGVMRGKIDSVTRDTLFSIVTFTSFDGSGPTKKTVFNPSEHSDFPAGMKVAVARAPRWSADMQMVFFGIREAMKAPAGRGAIVASASAVIQAGAPGAGGTINQTQGRGGAGGGGGSDPDPTLILWHWKDSRLQPEQIVQESADRAFNYLTEYRYDNNKVIRLVTDDLRSVTLSAGDKAAYGTDSREYEPASVTTGRNYADIYNVDLKTGERKLLFKKQPTGNGLRGVSPDGKRALFWGTDGHWWVIDLATGDKKNITKGVPTSFVDSEDDHNNIYPPANPTVGWAKDNSAVVLTDGWDFWKVPVDGGPAGAVNLTGDGKKTQVHYRSLYNFAAAAPGAGGRGGGGGGRGGRGGGGTANGIDLTKPMYISTYGEWTKKEGVSKVDPAKPGAAPIFFEPARFSITKARDAETFVMTKQTFTEYPNYWLASGMDLKPVRQLTDANPQMKDLAWSSGTRLINYTSAKGDKLQAAMYLPANFDPTKKYPMLVTIYEKRSQQMNGFVSPSETRAPDPSQYTSNGYVVLDPDIVYKVNDPGMSAVWCVVPAVQAAVATGFVDAKKVGLWGHSWGGYQTAFLVTQTNIFSAAIAGAPLTNMVSMYGSVYWNSGSTDASIFESSQGRFKGSFIQNYDAYIRNSPVFHADKVQTPLIILHNDKDGAVDFNQGVTYFNTLLNLQKDVMLLEYQGENHGLARPENQKDYAVRMREYFDFHLKGAPAADWIVNGVPRLKMNEHLQERKIVVDSTGKRIVP